MDKDGKAGGGRHTHLEVDLIRYFIVRLVLVVIVEGRIHLDAQLVVARQPFLPRLFVIVILEGLGIFLWLEGSGRGGFQLLLELLLSLLNALEVWLDPQGNTVPGRRRGLPPHHRVGSLAEEKRRRDARMDAEGDAER